MGRSIPPDSLLALEQFAKNDTRALYSYLRRELGDPEQARDVLQDTLVHATDRLPQFDSSKGSMRAWLFRLGQNRMRNLLRRREVESRATVQLTPVPTPLELADAKQRRRQLEEAIQCLPSKQRQTLLLRYQEGMSCAKIAALLGISPNAVSLQLHKARRSIQDHIAASEGGRNEL